MEEGISVLLGTLWPAMTRQHIHPDKGRNAFVFARRKGSYPFVTCFRSHPSSLLDSTSVVDSEVGKLVILLCNRIGACPEESISLFI